MLSLALVVPGLLGLSSNRTVPGDVELDSVWLARGSSLAKLTEAAAHLESQIELPSAIQAVAVDGRRKIVWALGHGELRGYNLTGRLLSSVSLPTKSGSDHAGLAVMTANGDVWIGAHKTLTRVSTTGQLISSLTVKQPIIAVAADQKQNKVWLATNKAVVAYGAAGEELGPLQLYSNAAIKDLAFDSSDGLLWVAQANALQWFARDGRSQVVVGQPGIKRIAADGHSGIWAAGDGRLIRIDASGARLLEVTLPNGTIDIATNIRDGSVWHLGNHRLTKYDVNGQLLVQRDWADLGVGKPHALALYVDLVPPVLRIVEPEPGKYLNVKRPQFRIAHDLDADSHTLAAKLDGAEIGLACQPGRSSTVCAPSVDLPEGERLVSLVVADYVGNLSQPAEVHFVVDTIAPQIVLTSPASGLITNQSPIPIVGRITETADLTLDGAELALSAEGSFVGSRVLAEGSNTLRLLATDLAGNESVRLVEVLLDTLPPPAPVSALISVSSISDGMLTVTGAPGSVEAGASVLVTNTRTGEVVVAEADAQGQFTVRISAQPGDILKITSRDAAANLGPATEVAVEGEVSIRIEAPAEAATVDVQVNISGTIEAPRNTGVTVNGMPAVVSPDGRFYLNNLALAPGSNQIVATAVAPGGATASDERQVNAQQRDGLIELRPSTSAGVAPLRIDLSYQVSLNRPVSTVHFDFDGDGTPEQASQTSSGIATFTYDAPGTYTLAVSAYDTSGKKAVKSLIIVVYPQRYFDALITTQWNGMNRALAAGDKTKALTFLTDKGREKYEPIFDALMPYMPEIVSTYSPIARISAFDHVAEYAVQTDGPDGLRVFFLYFVQDVDGVWRLESM